MDDNDERPKDRSSGAGRAPGRAARDAPVLPLDGGQLQLPEALRSELIDEFAKLQSGLVVGGEYELLKFLGAGAFGVVWLAQRVRFGDECVLKFTTRENRENMHGMNLSFFRGEARNQAAMGRRGGAPLVYGAGEEDNLCYIAMEYANQRSLRDLLRRLQDQGRALPYSQSIAWVQRLTSALRYNHETKRVVHRDLKPENLLCHCSEQGNKENFQTWDILVGDAGNSVKLDDAETAPGAERVWTRAGTQLYAAPEQWGHDDGSGVAAPAPSMDIYSVGVILAELCGMPPGEADFTKLSAAEAKFPGLTKLVARMCSRVPAERPTAAQVEERLAALLAPAARWPKWPARAVVGAAAVGLLVAAGTALNFERLPRTDADCNLPINRSYTLSHSDNPRPASARPSWQPGAIWAELQQLDVTTRATIDARILEYLQGENEATFDRVTQLADGSGPGIVVISAAAGVGKSFLARHVENISPTTKPVVVDLHRTWPDDWIQRQPTLDVGGRWFDKVVKLDPNVTSNQFFDHLLGKCHGSVVNSQRVCANLLVLDALDEIHPDSQRIIGGWICSEKNKSFPRVLVLGRPEATFNSMEPCKDSRGYYHGTLRPFKHNTAEKWAVSLANLWMYDSGKELQDIVDSQQKHVEEFERLILTTEFGATDMSLSERKHLVDIAGIGRTEDSQQYLHSLKLNYLHQLLSRSQRTHSRPGPDNQIDNFVPYCSALVRIAQTKASADETEYFGVRNFEKVPLLLDGQCFKVAMHQVLDYSGLVDLVPGYGGLRQYRFTPGWLHEFLASSDWEDNIPVVCNELQATPDRIRSTNDIFSGCAPSQH